MKFKFFSVLVCLAIGGFIFGDRDAISDDVRLIDRLGTVMWYNSPFAVDGNGKSYLGFMRSNRDVVVAELQGSDIVAKEVLHKWHYLDDHGTPVLFFRRGSKGAMLNAIYNLHHGPIYQREVVKPDDIGEWSEVREIFSGEATYPSIIQSATNTMLFFRRSTQQKSGPAMDYAVMKSNDSGVSWGGARSAVRAEPNTAVYAMPENSGDNIYLAWGVADTRNMIVRNLFLAVSHDSGSTWSSYRADASVSELGSNGHDALIVTPPGLETRVWDLHVAGGILSVVGVTGIGNEYEAWRLVVDFVGKRHESSKIGPVSVDYYAGGCSIDERDPDRVLIARMVDTVPVISAMHWNVAQSTWSETKRWDGGSFRLSRPFAVKAGTFDGFCLGVRSYSGFQKFDTCLIGLK
jgi:hypothetical protein